MAGPEEQKARAAKIADKYISREGGPGEMGMENKISFVLDSYKALDIDTIGSTYDAEVRVPSEGFFSSGPNEDVLAFLSSEEGGKFMSIHEAKIDRLISDIDALSSLPSYKSSAAEEFVAQLRKGVQRPYQFRHMFISSPKEEIPSAMESIMEKERIMEEVKLNMLLTRLLPQSA